MRSHEMRLDGKGKLVIVHGRLERRADLADECRAGVVIRRRSAQWDPRR